VRPGRQTDPTRQNVIREFVSHRLKPIRPFRVSQQPAAWQYSPQSAAPHCEPVLVSRLIYCLWKFGPRKKTAGSEMVNRPPPFKFSRLSTGEERDSDNKAIACRRRHECDTGHYSVFTSPFRGSGFFGYLSLEVWPARQARNAPSACSRSSALRNLGRGFFGGSATTGILPLTSSTPCRRIRRRCCIRDQFVRPLMTPN